MSSNAFTETLSTDAWTRPAIGLDSGVGDVGELPDYVVRSAQVEVCSRAVDVIEAALLLSMLGIGGAR